MKWPAGKRWKKSYGKQAKNINEILKALHPLSINLLPCLSLLRLHLASGPTAVTT
jgi:arginine decarboxylase-like protein